MKRGASQVEEVDLDEEVPRKKRQTINDLVFCELRALEMSIVKLWEEEGKPEKGVVCWKIKEGARPVRFSDPVLTEDEEIGTFATFSLSLVCKDNEDKKLWKLKMEVPNIRRFVELFQNDGLLTQICVMQRFVKEDQNLFLYLGFRAPLSSRTEEDTILHPLLCHPVESLCDEPPPSLFFGRNLFSHPDP